MASIENILSQLRIPVIGSPLFLASGLDLVKAQCQAGVVGSFPTLNARPVSLLDDWLYEIKESNAEFARQNPDMPVGPIAANLIVHRTNNRLEEDIELVVKHEVPVVITSLGAREDVYEAVHSYGGVVFHDVINNRFAHKAIDKGADALVAVAAGAGGHAGTLSPFALVSEIREWFDGYIALSGAIANGKSILAAQAAGADFGYVGSAFLSTPEANVAEEQRQMVLETTADEIVYTNLFTGVHGNYMRGSIEAAGLDPDALPASDPSKMNFGSGGNTKAKAWKDIWGAGQGIGTISEQLSTMELVMQWEREYKEAVAALDAKVAGQHKPVSSLSS